MGDLGNTIGAFIASLLLGRQRTGRVGDGLPGGGGPGIAPAGESIEPRAFVQIDEARIVRPIQSRFILPDHVARRILEICHSRGTCDRFGGGDMSLILGPMLLGLSNSAPAVEEEEASAGGSDVTRWIVDSGQAPVLGSVTDAAEHVVLLGKLRYGFAIIYLVKGWVVNQAVGGTNVLTLRIKDADGTVIGSMTFTVTIGNTVNGEFRFFLIIEPTEENSYSCWFGQFSGADGVGGSNFTTALGLFNAHTYTPGRDPDQPPPGEVDIQLTLQNSVATSTYNLQALKVWGLRC